MKLEDQIVSLDLAKRLKELGVPQESLFYHWQFRNDQLGRNEYDGVAEYKREQKRHGSYWVRLAAAFTVAELGELLSVHGTFIGGRNKLDRNLAEPYWCMEKKGDTEANARARMLICLLECQLRREEKSG